MKIRLRHICCSSSAVARWKLSNEPTSRSTFSRPPAVQQHGSLCSLGSVCRRRRGALLNLGWHRFSQLIMQQNKMGGVTSSALWHSSECRSGEEDQIKKTLQEMYVYAEWMWPLLSHNSRKVLICLFLGCQRLTFSDRKVSGRAVVAPLGILVTIVALT